MYQFMCIICVFWAGILIGVINTEKMPKWCKVLLIILAVLLLIVSSSSQLGFVGTILWGLLGSVTIVLYENKKDKQ